VLQAGRLVTEIINELGQCVKLKCCFHSGSNLP
jgi:hypothetical protein